MHPGDWLHLVAIGGLLVVAALSIVRSAGGLERALALLAVDVGAMNVASLSNHITGGAGIGVLADAVFTAMAVPFALHFVARFVRAGRAAGVLIAATYAAFAALAAASCFAAVRHEGAWIEGPTWSALFLGGCIPILLVAVALLALHLRSTADPREKTRTRLLLAAFAIGGALDTVDVITSATVNASYDVGSLGTVVAVGLVAVVVFRLRLFDRDLSTSAALYAGAMAIAAVASYLIVFWALSDRVALLVLGTTCVTLVTGLMVREFVESVSRARAQRDRLAVLGRFAAQMAHDVKNPLTAILGATRLIEDAAVTAEQRQFVDLIVDQARRINAIVEKYDRLGRIEPVLVPTNLGDLVRRVAAAQSVAAPGVCLSLAIEDERADAPIDQDLVAGALENLLRNAVEAMPGGGSIIVRVASRGAHAMVRIEDGGEGMDARRIERVFDDFYTTKARGGGLGLPFARRVAQAHGGDVLITSRRGKGTTVELRLPRARAEP